MTRERRLRLAVEAHDREIRVRELRTWLADAMECKQWDAVRERLATDIRRPIFISIIPYLVAKDTPFDIVERIISYVPLLWLQSIHECRNLLFDAYCNGRYDILRLLLQKGMNPNVQWGTYHSALHGVIEMEIAQWFIDAGIWLEFSCEDGTPDFFHTPLYRQLRRHNDDIVALILRHMRNPYRYRNSRLIEYSVYYLDSPIYQRACWLPLLMSPLCIRRLGLMSPLRLLTVDIIRSLGTYLLPYFDYGPEDYYPPNE